MNLSQQLFLLCSLSLFCSSDAVLAQTAPIAPTDTQPAPTAAIRRFTNPIQPSGADPWVIRQADDYYYCRATGGSLVVGKSRELLGIGTGTKKVFTPPAGQPYSKNLWAPELHYFDGKWFIYFAADDGKNENHRMYVLRSLTGDAQGEYEMMGPLDTGDRWAIDGHVFKWQDKLYFVWSGWEGTKNVAQNLYIAPMSNPWTVSGQRVLISTPEHPWEKNGRPLINEGPTVLTRGNRLFVIYSASGSWGDDYCLGRLDFSGDDILNPKNWKKHPQAVFARTDKVWGPGHASFVNDGQRDWIVYHAAKHPGAGWKRDVRLQPFTWNFDGTPNFGAPVAPGEMVE